jgi:hypothetical protein
MALACNLAYYLEHEPDNRHSKFFNPSGKENHCPVSATNICCFQDFGTVGVRDEVEVEVAETALNGFTPSHVAIRNPWERRMLRHERTGD